MLYEKFVNKKFENCLYIGFLEQALFKNINFVEANQKKIIFS